MTKFLLDSGDPDEYRTISTVAKENGSELWGVTTNPSLIAKKLTGTTVSNRQEAFELQKHIILEILEIVPGAVSAEVYADEKTTAEEMILQGRDIATWHERIYVKLPTTLEGLKARTELRKNKIPVNNTLVFTQQQVFAICLHERISQKEFGPIENEWPPFISPFVGRLDDLGENGLDLIKHGMDIKAEVGAKLWMLEASVRSLEHFKAGIDLGSESITAPSKMYEEWFALSRENQDKIEPDSYQQTLKSIKKWEISEDLLSIDSFEAFFKAIETNKLDIIHELTDKGLIRFADDWNALLR